MINQIVNSILTLIRAGKLAGIYVRDESIYFEMFNFFTSISSSKRVETNIKQQLDTNQSKNKRTTKHKQKSSRVGKDMADLKDLDPLHRLRLSSSIDE